jgi:4-oxalocrotonate tautomerase
MARVVAHARCALAVLLQLIIYKIRSIFINQKGKPMPTINVQLFEGRTVEQKRAFVKAVTEATVATLGSSAESVDIIIEDVKRENWATAGKLWSDV